MRAPCEASRGADGVRQVGPEVVDVLQADREPQQALGHATLRLDARAALDQRLEAAQAGRQRASRTESSQRRALGPSASSKASTPPAPAASGAARVRDPGAG